MNQQSSYLIDNKNLLHSSESSNKTSNVEESVATCEIKCFNVYLNSKGLLRYFCLICDTAIETGQDHLMHLKIHFTDKRLSCNGYIGHSHNSKCTSENVCGYSSCKKIFSGLYDFINHLNTVNCDKDNRNIIKEKLMLCFYCNKEFDDPHMRLKHMTISHLRKKLTNTNNVKNASNMNELALFPTKNVSVKCYVKGLPVNKSQVIITEDVIEVKSTQIALDSNYNSGNRKNPINEETRDTPVVQKKTKSHRTGERATHASKPVTVCDICGKNYANQYNLVHHIKTVHGNLRMHKCSICNKSFSHVSYLKPHMRIHTKEIPYECKLCGQKYRMIGQLTSHMLRHNNLRRHPCTVCDKKFYNTRDLRAHLNTHTGVKPYQCDQCGKCYRTPYALRQHLRSHAGEKPYVCTYCGKRFLQLAVLSAHMKTHGK